MKWIITCINKIAAKINAWLKPIKDTINMKVWQPIRRATARHYSRRRSRRNDDLLRKWGGPSRRDSGATSECGDSAGRSDDGENSSDERCAA